MDEEVPRPADAADHDPPAPTVPPPPQGPLAEAVENDADELRRLIDAGASSPEELRALAARIREHRELEQSLWRSDVRPGLLKSKKRRFNLRDLRDDPDPSQRSGNVKVGLALLGGVLVLLLAATQSSVLWLLLPVAAVLVYAYRLGTQARSEVGADPSPGDPPH